MTIQATRTRPGPNYLPGERPCDRCGITYEPGKEKLQTCADCRSLQCKNGQLTIPESFIIAVAPYEGGDPYKVMARFRYRLNGSELRLGYKLDRPDRVLQDAFDGISEEVQGITADMEGTFYNAG